MIDEQLMKQLHESIHLYDKKNNRNYLLVYNKGKKHPINFCQLTFSDYHFWHLLGCELNIHEKEEKTQKYNECKQGENISEYLSLVHNNSMAYEKKEIFHKLFDFVNNAKMIKIGCVEACPEQFYISMALGNTSGIIGYDDSREETGFLFPKTVQNKKIEGVTKNRGKILLILSKNRDDKEYNTLEYEIAKDSANNIIKQIPAHIKIAI